MPGPSTFLILFLGTLLVGAGLAYGLYKNSRRNRANDAITDEATRELYEDLDAYEHGGKARLDRAAA